MSGLTFFQPSPGPDAPCPLCGAPRPHSPRYPDCVCADCVRRAVDEAGRPLELCNTTLAHVCFIDGVRCRVDEAYFGGVVVRPDGAPAGLGNA